uniref:Pentatricopeptide repeat domain-containing protein n=1 Tax=Bionectria ochroleuca TaxID=29856 RepID=A0A0B7JLZ9_BIOOC
MQSLWATARRAHRCGHRAYSTTVAGLGRRVTNTPHRKPTFPDIFTACYMRTETGARPRQVEDVQRDLGNLRKQDMAYWVESSIERLTDDQMDHAWNCLRDIYSNRPYFKEMHKPARLRRSALRAGLQRDFYNCTETTLGLSLRNRATGGLRLAAAYEEVSDQITRRDPLSKVHLENFGKGIRNMVEKLLLRANARSADTIPSPSYDEAMRLLDSGYPFYQLRSIDMEAAKLNTVRINQANRVAINHRGIGTKEKIGRVCYNLLISAYPPDMHTFNSLMIELDGVHLTAFSEQIIHSFFFETYLKPTPTTFAAILSHYTLTKNHGKFMRTIASIVGLDPKSGAKVRRFHIDAALDDPIYRRWAMNTRDRTLLGDYVYEHLPLNRLVVEEILRGLIHFHMIPEAITFFTTCVRRNVDITTTTIRQVFDACVWTLDWSAGVRLLQEISKHVHLWKVLMKLCDYKTRAHLIERTYSIFDMVGMGGASRQISPERLADLELSSNKLLKLKAKVTRSASGLPEYLQPTRERGSLELDEGLRQSYSRALQIESLWKEITRVRKTFVSIESKFLKHPFTLEARAWMADRIGHDALERSNLLFTEMQESLEQWDLMEQKSNLQRRRTSAVSERLHAGEATRLENETQAHTPLLSNLVARSTGWGTQNVFMNVKVGTSHE